MKPKQLYKNIAKYPISNFLNILSLVIAFSGIITLLLYVSYEKSFDKYNENYKTVYKVVVSEEGVSVPAAMSPIIREKLANLDAITPVFHSGRWISKPETEKKEIYLQKYGAYVHNDIFDIFTYDFIYGSKEKALINPKTIVLTESLSNTLFGDINPVGKIVNVQKEAYTCTGVIKDLPENSSFDADYFVSFSTYSSQKDHWVHYWSEWSFRIFMKIDKAENYETVLSNLNAIKDIKDKINGEELVDEKQLYMLPLKELHYGIDTLYKTTNKTLLNVLLLLALILAIMGIINFINLMTSQALQRAKSYTVKRVLGARRIKLIVEIIIESVVISLLALSIAFLLHRFLYPILENILQIKGLGFEGREIWYFGLVVFAIVYGVIVGYYPARYITSVDISQTVKGGFFFSGTGKRIRNILLVLQFSFTIILLVGVVAIEKQMRFWHNFDTGIQKENILYIDTTRKIQEHEKAFTDEILSSPNISEYAYSQFIPGNVQMKWGRTVDNQPVSLWAWPVDEYFIDFFDVKIIEGRKFSSNMEADENNFILNKAAVNEFKWENPTERKFPGFGFEGEIVGITENFNFASLKGEVEPMALWLTDARHNVLFVKVEKGNLTQTIEHLEQVWNKFEKDGAFNYHFLDEYSEQLYRKEEGIAYFIKFVALWSVLLSLTGLLGLALFMARQRTKEIGIRRANGASIQDVMLLLNKDFIKWIFIAFIIAIPVAYYAINKWQESFAYKTEISWWIFALAGVLVLVISIISVSIQIFRVARKNPVDALRYE